MFAARGVIPESDTTSRSGEVSTITQPGGDLLVHGEQNELDFVGPQEYRFTVGFGF